MTKVLSLRVDDELADWASEYASGRGVTRQALIEQALQDFKVDCESGVPEIRARAARQASVRDVEEGVGLCPRREGGLGHVWAPPSVDSRRRCEFCLMPGRGDDQKDEHGYISSGGIERAEMFQSFAIPMVSGSGDPAKAWPKGMPPAMAARAEAIRAAKSLRDREAKS